MRHTARAFVIIPRLLLATGLVAARAGGGAQPPIVGTVSSVEGPITGAQVRLQTTEVRTTTGADGRFSLPRPKGAAQVTVTAWAPGFYVGWASATPGGGQISIVLKPYYNTDNIDYRWFSDEQVRGTVSCSHCMPAYIEWQRDAHSRSAMNPRFLTMYNGTDLDGHQSPPTRYAHSKAGDVPQRPDPSEPYYGPGFKLDHPDLAGNCGACHLPVAAVGRAGALSVDPNHLTDVEKDGVACELCHKIGEVALDPKTRLPYPDRPGVLSVRLFRPPDGQQLFFGPFDDVARRVSYLPLEEESAFCAPCHHGVFEGTTVYDSYGEWLASPYSDPKAGKTCQACHMPPAGYDAFVYPERGGLRRDRSRILSHTMPGAGSEELLHNAVTMTVDAHVSGGLLTVDVKITNDKTGHHVPTDSPLRQMILLVQAADGAGNPLTQLEGPTIPPSGGVGDPTAGNFAGLPGKVFAKVLQEVWTGVAPTGAYWNRTRVLSDNRIAAFATDTSSYGFAVRPARSATVEVRLVFRRAFKELAAIKKWPDSDVLMASWSTVVPPCEELATRRR